MDCLRRIPTPELMYRSLPIKVRLNVLHPHREETKSLASNDSRESEKGRKQNKIKIIRDKLCGRTGNKREHHTEWVNSAEKQEVKQPDFLTESPRHVLRWDC